MRVLVTGATGFVGSALRTVLGSAAFLNYGLFVGDRLAAYALLKIAPTGSAFIGRLVGYSPHL